MAPVVRKSVEKTRASSNVKSKDDTMVSRRTSLRKQAQTSQNVQKSRPSRIGSNPTKDTCFLLYKIRHSNPLGKDLNEESGREDLLQSRKETEGNYQCGKCYKLYQSIELLSAHSLDCNTTKLFQCNFCNDDFSTADSLVLHLESHADVVKPFRCGLCNAGFLENAALLVHLNENHSELPLMYKCQVCLLPFKEMSELKSHISEKHLSNLKQFRCGLCSKYFTKELKLSTHVQLHTQESSKLPKCSICLSSVPASIMNNHIATHEKEKSENVSATHRSLNLRKAKKTVGAVKKNVVKQERGSLRLKTPVNRNNMTSVENDNKTLVSEVIDFANQLENIEDADVKKVKRRRKKEKVAHLKQNPVPLKPRPAIKDTKELMATYMKIDPQTGDEVYDCDVCGIRIKDHDSFIQHRDDHFCDGKYCIKCQHCSQVFDTFENLNEHIGPNKCTGYKCDTCGKSFSLEPLLLTHQTKEHSSLTKQNGVLICVICEKTFENRTAYIRHASSHSEDKCIQCKLCRHAFTTQETLLGHMRTTHSIIPLTRKQYKYNCDDCGANFMKAEALTNHQAAVHNVEKNSIPLPSPVVKVRCPKPQPKKTLLSNNLSVKRTGHWRSAEDDKKRRTCPICNRVFGRFKDVRRHIGTHTKPFLCSHCGKSFPYRYSLDAHIKAYHSAENPHKCETCNKFFSCERSLIIHCRIHTGEKPHECHLCHKRFRQVANLSMHIKLHSTEKPIKCDLCDYRCSHQGYLKRHMSTHSTEKKHLCPICNKGFTEKPNLNHHLKRHSKIKNHVCAVCGHRFAERYYLNNHMRIHTKEKPYICPVCNRAFTMRPNMVSHIKKTHPSYNYQPIRPAHKQVADLNSHNISHSGANPLITSQGHSFTEILPTNDSFSSDISPISVVQSSPHPVTTIPQLLPQASCSLSPAPQFSLQQQSTQSSNLLTPSQLPLQPQSTQQTNTASISSNTDLLYHHLTPLVKIDALRFPPGSTPRDLLTHHYPAQQERESHPPPTQLLRESTIPGGEAGRELTAMEQNIHEGPKGRHHYLNINMSGRFVPTQCDHQRIPTPGQNFPTVPMATQDYMYTYPNMPSDNFLPVQGFFTNHPGTNTHREQKQ